MKSYCSYLWKPVPFNNLLTFYKSPFINISFWKPQLNATFIVFVYIFELNLLKHFWEGHAHRKSRTASILVLWKLQCLRSLQKINFHHRDQTTVFYPNIIKNYVAFKSRPSKVGQQINTNLDSTYVHVLYSSRWGVWVLNGCTWIRWVIQTIESLFVSDVSTINTTLILQKIRKKGERFVCLILIFNINYPEVLEIRNCLYPCIHYHVLLIQYRQAKKIYDRTLDVISTPVILQQQRNVYWHAKVSYSCRFNIFTSH